MIYNIKSENYQDFKVFQQNRLMPRSYFIPFSNRPSCDKEEYTDFRYSSDRTTVLNGKWDFIFFGNCSEIPKVFDSERAKFEKINVPSCWQMKGYENPFYLNSRYIFNCNPPQIPTKSPVGLYSDGKSKKIINAKNVYNTAGIYRRFVDVRRLDKTYIITFYGVSSCLELYINGKYAGYSEGSRNTAEFDISQLLVEGTNEFLVVVRKWCNGSYLECQDMFRNSGIFRDVVLFMNNKTYIYDYNFKSEAKGEGGYDVNLDVTVKEYEGYKLRVSLEDKKGKENFAVTLDIKDEVTAIAFDGAYKEYSAEDPILYNLYMSLVKDNIVTECICKKIGFKRIEISEGVFLYNGKPIKIKGINHQDTDPENGSYMTPEAMLKDIKLMKEYNINAVKTSHYPPDPLFVELCDIEGLYVIAEADIDTHGTCFSPFFKPNMISRNPDWKRHFLDRTARMYGSLKNQPSIIMWSLGHSAGCSLCQDYCYDYLKSVTDLPVEYSGAAETKKLCYDVFSANYATATELKDFLLKGYQGRPLPLKPVFLSEYADTTGTGPGNLKEYTEIFEESERFMGGCIYQFSDHVISHTTGNYSNTYGGDHGEFIDDGGFCGRGVFSPDRKPHLGALSMQYVYRPLRARLIDKNTIEIFNTNYFKSSSDIKITGKVYFEGKEINKININASIAPRTARQFDIFLGHTEGDMFLNIEYKNKNTGNIVAIEQLALNEALTEIESKEGKHISVSDIKDVLTVNFDCGNLRIDKIRGCILSYTIAGTDYLNAEPTRRGTNCFATNILRPRTGYTDKKSIDLINVTLRDFCYNIKNENGKPSRVEIIINSIFYINDRESYIAQDMYVINAGGRLDVYTTLHPRQKKLDRLTNFGKLIKIPSSFNEVIYYGREESYPDIKEHSPISRYTKKAADFAAKQVYPQESGNCCDTRYALVKNASGQGLMFVALGAPFNLNVKLYPKWKIDSAKHIEDLGESDGVYIQIDGEVSGVGSSCGVLEKYKIPLRDNYVMGFSVIPFANMTE